MAKQFLVLLSHSMDDIPLRLFDDGQAAMEFTIGITADTPVPAYWPCDCGTPDSVSVIEFHDGIPVERHYAKNLTAGEAVVGGDSQQDG